MPMSEADRAAAAWEPPTRDHDPRNLAFARECYVAGYEAGATDLGRLRDVARLRAELERLTRERDDALIALGRQTYTAPYRELVAWNNGDGPDPRDKTDAEWIAIARLRLVAAGLAAAPAAEKGGESCVNGTS